MGKYVDCEVYKGADGLLRYKGSELVDSFTVEKGKYAGRCIRDSLLSHAADFPTFVGYGYKFDNGVGISLMPRERVLDGVGAAKVPDFVRFIKQE